MLPIKGVSFGVALLLILIAIAPMVYAASWESYWEPGQLPPDDIVATGVFSGGTLSYRITNGTHYPYDKMRVKVHFNENSSEAQLPKAGYSLIFGIKTNIGEEPNTVDVQIISYDTVHPGNNIERERYLQNTIGGARWPLTVRLGVVALKNDIIVGVLMSAIKIPVHPIVASMVTEKEWYTPYETLKVTISNGGKGGIETGSYYSIEGFNGVVWTPVQTFDITFTLLAYPIEINQSRAFNVQLSHNTLYNGRYRVVKEVLSSYDWPIVKETLYAEFTVVGSGPSLFGQGYMFYVGAFIVAVGLVFVVIRLIPRRKWSKPVQE